MNVYNLTSFVLRAKFCYLILRRLRSSKYLDTLLPFLVGSANLAQIKKPASIFTH